jgi:hypothetical protein
MLYREIIAVCSEINTKHINTLCGQNVGFVNATLGGAYSNQWDYEVNHSHSTKLQTILTAHSLC